jgi:hypothetical protein
LKIVFLSVLVLLFNLGAFAQVPNAFGIEDIYLARDDGSGQAGDAAHDFVITDVPIYCVVLLGSADPVTVKMNLVAAKVPGVKADTKVVTTSYTTKNGENRVNFSGRPESLWVVGTYRVDIFVDGKPAGNLEFEIKRSDAARKGLSYVPPRPKPPNEPERN